MANSNDFFPPFGTGSGANVLTPATWAVDPNRTAGFQNGIANPAEANTAWRQASFPAAMLAQFTADFGPGNVVDNGNLAAFEAQFEAALRSYLAGFFSPLVPTPNWFVDGTNGTDAVGQGQTAGAGAFKTIPFAIATIQQFFSLGIVAVNIASGTYAPFTVSASGIGAWNFVCASGVTIAAPSSSVNNGVAAQFDQGVVATISGAKFTSFGPNITCAGGQVMANGCNYTGPSSGSATSILVSSGQANIFGNSVYSGNGAGIFLCNSPGKLALGVVAGGSSPAVPLTLSVTGTPAFSTACAEATDIGLIFVNTGSTITGSATGTRFIAKNNGVIDTQGAGVNFFPGSVAGTNTNGVYA
jgi:hypothetical protein